MIDNNTGNQPDISYSQWAQCDYKGFKPIGYDPNNSGGTNRFMGNYDGNNYSISNLYINRPDESNVGLFGHIGESGSGDGVLINDVGLSSVTINGGRGTGSLVGRVTGDEDTYIQYCYANNGTVVGDGATGGLVGSNNSYSSSPSNRNEHPVIQYCWAYTNVSWSRKENSGADKFGGLVGCNQKGKTFFSYAKGTVTVNNDPAVTVSNTDGPVPSRIGGLIGCILKRGLVESSYSTGLVTTEGSVANVGGFVGRGGTGGSDGNAYDCFFDNLSGNPSTSATPYLPNGVTSTTTLAMQTQSTYENAGWDFTNIWSIAENEYPTLQSNEPTIESITFTDGSGLTPSVTPGNTNQVIGRFSLSTTSGTSYLERVTVKLGGTRSGASNFKLWESTDATFNSGSDTQYGLTVSTDPGTDESISFSKSGFSVTTSTKYYFLTCDVASDATGTIDAELFDGTSLNFYGGEVSGVPLSEEPLSNGGATLPVELSAFTGQYINSVPTLYWSTQTQTDNLGWNVYRNKENDFTSADRVNSDLIPGHGTTSQVQNYVYEDTEGNFKAGNNFWYWLESIDYSGTVNHYDRVALIHIPEIQNPDPHSAVPRKYGLQTGPNPFNSNLSVSYMLNQTDMVRVEIYNLYGQLVAEFNEGLKTADREYTIDWDGKDLYGQNVASGVLLIKLITSEGSETTKAILLR